LPGILVGVVVKNNILSYGDDDDGLFLAKVSWRTVVALSNGRLLVGFDKRYGRRYPPFAWMPFWLKAKVVVLFFLLTTTLLRASVPKWQWLTHFHLVYER